MTSSSRASASALISFASASRRLGPPAIAEGTTTSRCPSRAKRATRRATPRVRSGLPTEGPPDFWTISDPVASRTKGPFYRDAPPRRGGGILGHEIPGAGIGQPGGSRPRHPPPRSARRRGGARPRHGRTERDRALPPRPGNGHELRAGDLPPDLPARAARYPGEAARFVSRLRERGAAH